MRLLNVYWSVTLILCSFPCKDDMNLFDYNVPERVNDFVAAAISQVISSQGRIQDLFFEGANNLFNLWV